jgi:cytochrome c oxidase assembly factor CtaG
LAFFAGLAVLAASLLPPLDRWSASSFAFHMTQHELLMLVAAPLMVLGRPLPYFFWSLPDSWRPGVARAIRHPAVRGFWSGLLNPTFAWAFHAAVLWVWHAPSFFDAALRSRGIHDFQHLCFLVSALVFWSALLEERARERQGAAVLYLFTTTVHTGVLGALLTFASHPWYAAYVFTTPEWNLSPLEDQQIGGLIMWVPASVVYVGVGLALLGRWILSSDGPTGYNACRSATDNRRGT